MADTPERLAERLRAEGAKTLAFFGALTPDQWEAQIYADGALWSVKSLLCHFVGAENGMGRLIENILAGGSGTPEEFDLDAYNQRKVAELDGLSTELLLSSYHQFRQRTIEIVKNLSEQDLEKRGRHPFLGNVPLVEIIKMIYLHNQIHLRDIRKLLG